MPEVQANGIRIHYEERGQGDPLILIMGLGADGPVWEEHAKVYEAHFHCILMDNRGVGKSEKPAGPYAIRMMADDTAGLMDALKIDQARVAGISMGGAIAQELSINYPQKVRSQIVACSWAKCDTYARTVFEHFKIVRSRLRGDEWLKTLELWIFTAPHYETNYEDLVQIQKDTWGYEYQQPQYSFEAQCDACITHDTTSQLGQIKTPTLITVGQDDIFTPLRFSEFLHEQIASSELFVMKHCGHAHHWEDLQSFNSKTLEWLQAH